MHRCGTQNRSPSPPRPGSTTSARAPDGGRRMIASVKKMYDHKIKTAAELAKIIGARPRDKTVIMCHGVFDVVHPGHLRHLIYAKSKADILVTSLTADRHISKGTYR